MSIHLRQRLAEMGQELAREKRDRQDDKRRITELARALARADREIELLRGLRSGFWNRIAFCLGLYKIGLHRRIGPEHVFIIQVNACASKKWNVHVRGNTEWYGTGDSINNAIGNLISNHANRLGLFVSLTDSTPPVGNYALHEKEGWRKV